MITEKGTVFIDLDGGRYYTEGTEVYVEPKTEIVPLPNTKELAVDSHFLGIEVNVDPVFLYVDNVYPNILPPYRIIKHFSSQALDATITTLDNHLLEYDTYKTDTGATLNALATADTDLSTRITANADGITVNAGKITVLQADLDNITTGSNANALAIDSLEVEVSDINGTLSAQAISITNLESSVADVENGQAGNATAITELTTRVTSNEDGITATSSLITELETDVYNLETEQSAQATAISTLQTDVVSNENGITANAVSITDLEVVVYDANTGVSANATAIDSLETTVSIHGDDIIANASSVTSIESTISSDLRVIIKSATEPTTRDDASALKDGDIWIDTDDDNAAYIYDLATTSWEPYDGKVKLDVIANASAITSLETTVTQHGDDITANATAITALESTVNDPNTGVNANASAINTLETNVSTIDGEVTANATAITAINSELTNDLKTVIRSATEPTERVSTDPLVDGDIWIDSDDGDTAYVWDSGTLTWLPYDGKLKDQYSATADATFTLETQVQGDENNVGLIDSVAELQVSVTSIEDNPPGTLIFRQDTAPADRGTDSDGATLPLVIGDLWINTSIVNLDELGEISSWDGTAWIESEKDFKAGFAGIQTRVTSVEDNLEATAVLYVKADSSIGAIDLKANADTGSVINIQSDLLNIDALTTFAANYDPSTKETPTGAQTKADTAEGNANTHTDQELATGLTTVGVIIRSDIEPTQRVNGTALQVGDVWIETDDGDAPWTYNGISFIRSFTRIDGGFIQTGVVDTQRLDVVGIFAQDAAIAGTLTLGDPVTVNIATNANAPAINQYGATYSPTDISISLGGSTAKATETTPYIATEKENITVVTFYDFSLDQAGTTDGWYGIRRVAIALMGKVGTNDPKVITENIYTAGGPSLFFDEYLIGNTFDFDNVGIRVIIERDSTTTSTADLTISDITITQQSSSIALSSDGLYQRISATKVVPYGSGGSGSALTVEGSNIIDWTAIANNPFEAYVPSDFAELGDSVNFHNLTLTGALDAIGNVTGSNLNISNWNTGYNRSVTSFARSATANGGHLNIHRANETTLSTNLKTLGVGDTRQTGDFPNSDGTSSYMPTPNNMPKYALTPIFSQDWPGGSWGGILNVAGWNTNYANWQIAGNSNTSTEDAWYLRTGVGTSWNAWKQIAVHGDNVVFNGGTFTSRVEVEALDIVDTTGIAELHLDYAVGSSGDIRGFESGTLDTILRLQNSQFAFTGYPSGSAVRYVNINNSGIDLINGNYRVSGTTVIDSSRDAFFNSLDVGGEGSSIKLAVLSSDYEVARFRRTLDGNPAISLGNQTDGELLNLGSRNDGRAFLSLRGLKRFGIDTIQPSHTLDVNGDVGIGSFAQSSAGYTSGILGSGTQWNMETGDGSFFEVDNMRVRNSFRTHIFQKDVVRTLNGYFYVSDSGIVSSITGTTGTGTVTFKDAQSASFQIGDTVWVKGIQDGGAIITGTKFRITSTGTVSGDGITYNVSVVSGNLADIQDGMTGARINRGSILFDSSSQYAPFMDIYDDEVIYDTGSISEPVNVSTNYAGGDKWYFTTPFSGQVKVTITGFDFEGGVRWGLNGTEISNMSSANDATVEYEFWVQAQAGSNEISIWSDNADGGSTKRIVVEAQQSLKSRHGNLEGVVSPVFGSLQGHGSYIQNLYAEGNAQIAGTLTAGDANGVGNTFYAGRIKKNIAENYNNVTGIATNTTVTYDIPDPFGGTEAVEISNINSTASSTWHHIHTGNYTAGDIYTLSVWVRTPNGSVGYSAQSTGGNAYFSTGIFSGDTNGEWKRVSVTGTISGSGTDSHLKLDLSADQTIQVFGIQFEKDNKVTAYQPTDGTIASSDEGFGMWAVAGGFGGTIQNPKIALADEGIVVRKEGASSAWLSDDTISIGYSDNEWGIIGKVGVNTIFQLGSANQIAGWGFDNRMISNATGDGRIYILADTVGFSGSSKGGTSIVVDNVSGDVRISMGEVFTQTGNAGNPGFESADGINVWQSGVGDIFSAYKTRAGALRTQIAGWNFTDEYIQKVVGDTFISMSSGLNPAVQISQGFSLYRDDADVADVNNSVKLIRMGLIGNPDSYNSLTNGSYGIQIGVGNSTNFKDIFRVDENGAKIAGFSFDDEVFQSTNNTGFGGVGMYLNPVLNQFSLASTFTVNDGVLTATDAILSGEFGDAGGNYLIDANGMRIAQSALYTAERSLMFFDSDSQDYINANKFEIFASNTEGIIGANSDMDIKLVTVSGGIKLQTNFANITADGDNIILSSPRIRSIGQTNFEGETVYDYTTFSLSSSTTRAIKTDHSVVILTSTGSSARINRIANADDSTPALGKVLTLVNSGDNNIQLRNDVANNEGTASNLIFADNNTAQNFFRNSCLTMVYYFGGWHVQQDAGSY